MTRARRAVARQMQASPALRRAVLASMRAGLAGQVACLGGFALLAARGGSLVPCLVMAVAVPASAAGVSVARGWPLTAAVRLDEPRPYAFTRAELIEALRRRGPTAHGGGPAVVLEDGAALKALADSIIKALGGPART